MSLVPPLVAIVLAVLTRNVVPALFAGIWLGATMLNGWNPLLGLWATFRDFVIPNVGDPWSATVLIYCGLFGVLIAFLQRTGGAHALAAAIANKVRTPAGAQGSTWFFGLIIFFEDYFNALTVGSVMRSVSDRMRVAREKLAYIVDSTSAPICLLAPVSTWVVFVMGLIGTQSETLGLEGSSYVTYLTTIPFNFYAIFALAMVVVIAFTRIEYGPMAAAEYRARTTGKVMRDGAQPPTGQEITNIDPVEGRKPRIRNMLVPLGVLLGLIPVLFLWTGGFPQNDLVTAIGESEGALSILIASFTAGVVALSMGLVQRQYSFKEAMEMVISGVKGMTMVYVILALAWSIGSVTEEMGTADYVIQLAESGVPVTIVPVLIFIAGCVVAFTTGTSYGTFAILIPIAMPLGVALDIPMAIMIAAVFSGGIFGDHCSPISDTTVLSSTGAACDHIDHVNTQIPYAVTAAVAAVCGFLVAGATGSAALGLAAGAVVLIVLMLVLYRVWGQAVPDLSTVLAREKQDTEESR
ncbi:Na+/H+ antiporter NhaC family protein [Spiractinospora alimapuensis]|uniref:Na+/H+ antiporter NhaC family protein n=1 Tax=Spiractinospora alimapuensis TaxID=2820884 RepID=UPI001F30FB11|nr:Na+/H+ antiporter NhaC family protein [Spiractinospora alimapuensis]QVQ51206.1 Na+/H+ antiporter NhaC family protein [Spiractinospora alimapuensis]